MSKESLATGDGLSGLGTDPGSPYYAWTNYIDGGVDPTLIEFPEHERFNILRGWPIEGAINAYYEMSATVQPNDPPPADQPDILRGQWVQFDATGKVQLATGADVDNVSPESPKMIMLALDSSTSTTVSASGKLPVLTQNYVVRTDQIIGTKTATNFSIGDAVYCVDGLLTNDKTEQGLASGAPTGLQVIGYVRGVDVARNTVDVEVN